MRIPCKITGVPQPVITWKKKGATIIPSTSYTIEQLLILFTQSHFCVIHLIFVFPKGLEERLLILYHNSSVMFKSRVTTGCKFRLQTAIDKSLIFFHPYSPITFCIVYYPPEFMLTLDITFNDFLSICRNLHNTKADLNQSTFAYFIVFFLILP